MSAMKRLFQVMADKKASDIFLSVGAPINIKINGNAVPVNQTVMTAETVRQLLYEVLNERQIKEYEEEMELNTAFALEGVGAFRISAFRQKGTPAVVVLIGLGYGRLDMFVDIALSLFLLNVVTTLLLARYMRETALGAVPKARPRLFEMAVVRELARIGNNLNQLAHVANLNDETLEVLGRIAVSHAEAGATVRAEDLRAFAKSRLAPYKVPKDVLLVSDLPRNAMGKVTKPDVRSLFAPDDDE